MLRARLQVLLVSLVASLVTALVSACDPDNVVQGPDAGDPGPDATASSLCWERCAEDTWLEPAPPGSPDHVVCHDTGATCDLVPCDALLAEGGCGEAKIWCPPSYNGACWCNSAPESGQPDAWCLR